MLQNVTWLAIVAVQPAANELPKVRHVWCPSQQFPAGWNAAGALQLGMLAWCATKALAAGIDAGFTYVAMHFGLITYSSPDEFSEARLRLAGWQSEYPSAGCNCRIVENTRKSEFNILHN